MSGTEGQLVNGRYRLGETVGRGGMGRVWRARDETLDREVAVKELLVPAELPDHDRADLIARTMREARAAARLRHPGIITIHDVVEDGGVPWVVMEFVDGPSLAQAVKDEGRLSPERVAAFGADLADALAHAHSLGIVHRDLKPDNVLLSGTRAVITDFGIAKIMDVETRLTHTGTVIGTPKFMSPEQLENRSVEAPSDVWSLGVTLYSAIEGRPPFEGATLTALVTAILTAPLPRPEHAGPLAPVLGAMLAKDADRRPDAAGVRDRLRSLGDPTVPYQAPFIPPQGEERTLRYEPTKVEEPVYQRTAEQPQQGGYEPQRMYGPAGHPAGPSPTSPMPVGSPGGGGPGGSTSVMPGGGAGSDAGAEGASRRRLILGGAAAVVAIAGAAVGATKLLGPGHSDQNGANGHPGTGPSSTPATTRGSAGATKPSVTSASSSTAASLTFGDPVTLPGHTGKVFFVTYSPDGTMMASASADTTVRLWKTADHSSAGTLKGHTDIVFSVAFSPDGKTLASGSADGTVRLWDVESQSPVRTLRPGSGTGLVGPVAFSPDGKTLASGSNDGVIRLWDPKNGSRKGELHGHSQVVETLAFGPDGTDLLASGSDDKTARLWSVSGQSPVAVLQHPDQVHGLAFSHDGKLATACFDHNAYVWNAIGASGSSQPIGTLTGSTDKLETVAFHPTKPFVASAGWDSTTRVYSDADTSGKALSSLGGHQLTVESVAFSPDGKSMASCGWDTKILLWPVQ